MFSINDFFNKQKKISNKSTELLKEEISTGEFPDTKEQLTTPNDPITDKNQLEELNESKISNVIPATKVIINGDVIDNPEEGFSLANKGNKITMDIQISTKLQKNDNLN